ncbi:MAG: di-trans,poly-cis-decaprenylcistransferase [Thermoproteota archaeon]|nr:MAG: di-trans,poly-cis-decaprenylcistransferase [Candidatus Korarchaeota archaeon]
MRPLDKVVDKFGNFLYKLASLVQIPIYQRYLERVVKKGPIPQHIAIILDGNRRYARMMNLPLEQGYALGAKKVRQILEWCDELGIQHVTLYSFSTENFRRPPDQVKAILSVIEDQLRDILDNLDELRRRGVKIRIIGRLELIPDGLRELATEVERRTACFGEKTINLAIAYGGRTEILDAVRRIAMEVKEGKIRPEEINEDVFRSYLYLKDLPDPDLIIRTSGEERISNFLLWHIAYSELYFCEAYLPAFRKIDFLRAIRDYQRRSRRFGA